MTNTEIDEILDELPGSWCYDCKHPVCISRRKAANAAIRNLIIQKCIDAVEAFVAELNSQPQHQPLPGTPKDYVNQKKTEFIAALSKEPKIYLSFAGTNDTPKNPEGLKKFIDEIRPGLEHRVFKESEQ